MIASVMNFSRLYSTRSTRSTKEPTARQRAILIGGLLGDANMQFWGRNWRIRFLQKSDELVFWLYAEFNEWVSTKPQMDKLLRWWFNTKVIPGINDIGHAIYPDATKDGRVGTKVLPGNIGELLTDPLSLAVWFMGDGSIREPGYILCTDNFTLSEVELLQVVLSTNFGIHHTSINWKGGNPRLRILFGSQAQFTSLIRPYILPGMLYKLHNS